MQRLLSLSSLRGLPAVTVNGATSILSHEAISATSTSTSAAWSALQQRTAVSLRHFAAGSTPYNPGYPSDNSSSSSLYNAGSAPSHGGSGVVGVRRASSTSSASSSTSWTAPAEVLPFSEGRPPPVPPQYENLGKVAGPFTVEPQAAFAVVEVGGTQYKVTPDDLIYSEKLGGVDVNDTVSLSRVLMLGTPSTTIVGRPYVVGARVTAVVEEQFLDGKVLIFKKRRRKNSRRLKGHRQPLTALRITKVEGLPSD